MKICPKCQEIIPRYELKKAVVFTAGKIKNGIFHGNEAYYYHKECVQIKEDLLHL